jgi:P-type Cu+ transporter
MPSQSAIDPVCGMRVDPSAAADSRTHQGTTYHFCSAWCARKFDDDADAYIAASQAMGDVDVTDDPHP